MTSGCESDINAVWPLAGCDDSDLERDKLCVYLRTNIVSRELKSRSFTIKDGATGRPVRSVKRAVELAWRVSIRRGNNN
jgi:hypothetical protein